LNIYSLLSTPTRSRSSKLMRNFHIFCICTHLHQTSVWSFVAYVLSMFFWHERCDELTKIIRHMRTLSHFTFHPHWIFFIIKTPYFITFFRHQSSSGSTQWWTHHIDCRWCSVKQSITRKRISIWKIRYELWHFRGWNAELVQLKTRTSCTAQCYLWATFPRFSKKPCLHGPTRIVTKTTRDATTTRCQGEFIVHVHSTTKI
jgi:hypothetical protein